MTEIVSVYQSVFFSFFLYIDMTMTYTVRTGDWGACMIGEKKILLDEFSLLACSSNNPPPIILLKKERKKSERLIHKKAFPSLDGIDEYESNTSNKHDMLFLCVSATYIHRHTKRCGICVCAHWSREERQKEDVSKRGKKKRIGLKGNISTSFA